MSNDATAGQQRRIRFGLQVNPSPEDIDKVAADAETAGFDVVTVADHIGTGIGSPLITLARIAGVTSSIQLGTMVINNDMRNPVQLAWEAVTLHRLSGGRFELGLGAGHTPHEYTATGIDRDEPSTRKARLREAVEIIRALVRGETVTHHGTHYHLTEASIADAESLPSSLPILVGGNGTALLSHAAKHADAIGLQGLGRTLEDGHSHSVKFDIDHLESQLAVIADAADGVVPELAALVQMLEITDDREQAMAPVAERVPGLSMDAALTTPYLAAGTVDEIAAQFIATRDRWNISYFTVRSLELAPIIARVRALDNASAA